MQQLLDTLSCCPRFSWCYASVRQSWGCGEVSVANLRWWRSESFQTKAFQEKAAEGMLFKWYSLNLTNLSLWPLYMTQGFQLRTASWLIRPHELWVTPYAHLLWVISHFGGGHIELCFISSSSFQHLFTYMSVKWPGCVKQSSLRIRSDTFFVTIT